MSTKNLKRMMLVTGMITSGCLYGWLGVVVIVSGVVAYKYCLAMDNLFDEARREGLVANA